VKRASTLAIGTVPVVALAAAVIGSSHAIAYTQVGQIDISAAAMGHGYPQI